MWPNYRIFVDSNLVCPKTLGMNQQSLRLVEQFEWTSCLDICIYMFHLRDRQRRGGLPVCFYLSSLLRQIPARVKSGGYRWISSLQSVQCIGQTKKTSIREEEKLSSSSSSSSSSSRTIEVHSLFVSPFYKYVHGSVHHKTILIIVQQDSTVCSLSYFTARSLYMFRVSSTPIIRST